MSRSNAHMAMNVIMDKKESKVLYVEANSHFVDILLSFLTFPLGKMLGFLQNHYDQVGSLSSLYRGLSNLDTSHFCVAGAKQMLLNPTSSFEAEWRRLKVDFTCTKPAKYYVCGEVNDSDCPYSWNLNVSMHCNIADCHCGKPLNREVHMIRPEAVDADGGFIRVSDMPFIITDDLRVVPVVTGSYVQTLHSLGITDIDDVEIGSFIFGIDEVMELLYSCFTSSTPLTDLIIGDTEKSYTEDKSHRFENGIVHSKKMVLKISLQKSTHKFLFAQANEDFVDLLFSFLAVPLGGVESIFGGNSCLSNFNNLSKSISDSIDQKYFTTPDTKNRLIHFKLPYGYISKDEFHPLTQDTTPPKLYYKLPSYDSRICYFNDRGFGSLVSSFKSIQGQENYLSKSAMCFVTDDLTVSIGMSTCIPILRRLGVALSDVKEVDLQIGMEEVFSILKASFSSSTALSDVINPMLNVIDTTAPT